jgi:hypothetical protein
MNKIPISTLHQISSSIFFLQTLKHVIQYPMTCLGEIYLYLNFYILYVDVKRVLVLENLHAKEIEFLHSRLLDTPPDELFTKRYNYFAIVSHHVCLMYKNGLATSSLSHGFHFAKSEPEPEPGTLHPKPEGTRTRKTRTR